MKCCAFLGTSPYSPCIYRRGDWRSPPLRFVQTALALEVGESLEEVVIFATDQARQKNGQALIDEMADQGVGVRPRLVAIPRGRSREEMVTIYEKVSEHIDDGDRLIFDITHGFRSQPVLGLLVINYLQAVHRDLEVRDIVYGAFDLEAFRAFEGPGHPTFDIVSLMPLWELNRMAKAFEIFETTGHVGALEQEAKATQQRVMRAIDGRPPEYPGLHNFGKYLGGFRENMDLCAVPLMHGDDDRPGQMARFADKLDEDWNNFTREMGRFISPLKERMASTVRDMSAGQWDSVQGLEAQLKVMRWMESHGRYQACLTVGREWINLLVALVLQRHPSDEAHHGFLGRLSRSSVDKEQIDEEIQRIIDLFGDQILTVVHQIAESRNAVNHCWVGRTQSANPGKQVSSAIAAMMDHFPRYLDIYREQAPV